jgi:hypothetical protein
MDLSRGLGDVYKRQPDGLLLLRDFLTVAQPTMELPIFRY